MTKIQHRSKLLSRIILLMMVGIMALLPAVSLADTRVRITKQPENVTVNPGDNAVFTAKAQNDTGITWRMVSPDGRTVFLVKEIGRHFPGASVSGRNSDQLTIRNVSAEMHGWQVFCTYGGANRVETDRASIFILGADEAENNDRPGEATPPPFAYHGSAALTVTAVGASLEVNGNAASSTVDFSAKGTIDCKVTAPGRVDYWVINGAKYKFDLMPKSITIRDLTWPLTIEAVAPGQPSQTLLLDDQLQQKRTGEKLMVYSKTADMCHIRPNLYGAGGWFREFDFTDDFINQATEQKEPGGRVTLNVRAYIPKDKKLSHWKFNEAHFYFNTKPTEFYVWNLNEPMIYQPVFDNVDPTPTPVPMWTITCKYSCVFSGGGYNRAKSGTVPDGTSITLYPTVDALGWWESNLPFATKGTSDYPVDAYNIHFTIHKNIWATWMYVIN